MGRPSPKAFGFLKLGDMMTRLYSPAVMKRGRKTGRMGRGKEGEEKGGERGKERRIKRSEAKRKSGLGSWEVLSFMYSKADNNEGKGSSRSWHLDVNNESDSHRDLKQWWLSIPYYAEALLDKGKVFLSWTEASERWFRPWLVSVLERTEKKDPRESNRQG